jgi:hypothetical protein
MSAIVFGLCVVVAAPLLAQERQPRRLLEYLKPGGHVALGPVMTTGNYIASILTPEQFAQLNDTRKLSFAQMLAKYPALQKDVDLQKVEIAKQMEELQRGRAVDENWDQHLEFEKGQYLSLCRILHVGEDYVLLEVDAKGPVKMAVAAATITRVTWYPGLRIQHQHRSGQTLIQPQ